MYTLSGVYRDRAYHQVVIYSDVRLNDKWTGDTTTLVACDSAWNSITYDIVEYM